MFGAGAMTGRGFTVKKNWDNPVENGRRGDPAEARVPAEMRLGAVVVRPATVLAPMAGVTDTVFRRFIRHASLFSREQGTGNSHPSEQKSFVGDPASVETPTKRGANMLCAYGAVVWGLLLRCSIKPGSVGWLRSPVPPPRRTRDRGHPLHLRHGVLVRFCSFFPSRLPA